MSELEKDANTEYEYESGQERPVTALERVKYLEERGMHIPAALQNEADKASAELEKLGLGPKLVPCFEYLMIPANEHRPYEVVTAKLPLRDDGCVPAGDQIPNLVKSHFANQGRSQTVSDERLGEHARATLGEQASAVSSHAFAEATAHGSVETFALVRPAAANDHAGVYIYLDEIGALKELPLNSRASALARACGHPESCVFYGDVFVGRVCTVPAPMRNGDFKLEDLNSSNTWIKTAASENFQYTMGMKEVEAALEKKGDKAQQIKLGGFDEGELPGGEGPGFTWSQTKADVEVCVTLPPGTKAKQLAVDIKRNSLKVALLSGGVLFEAPQLNAGVNADESTWTIEDGSLMLTLEKARKDGIWRMLNVEGEGGDKGICSSE